MQKRQVTGFRMLVLGHKLKLRNPLTRTSSFLGPTAPFPRAYINRRSELHPISLKKHTDPLAPLAGGRDPEGRRTYP